MKLEGRVAVVTGGSRGIGLAIARALHRAGAKVALMARDEAHLAAAAERLVADSGPTPGSARPLTLPVDVADSAAVSAAFETVATTLGPVELLVNNAGVVHRAPLHETSPAAFDRVLGVNLRGAYLCTRAVLPAMIACGRGRIVNVSSISGTLGTPLLSAYCASKWGLLGLTKAVAEEVRAHGILVTAVCPGSVDTEMLKEGAPGLTPDMSPAEVAGTILYLLSGAPLAMSGSAVELFG